MRIVYIVQYFRRPTESGSSRSFEQARRMASAGHDVHIVTSILEDEVHSGWQSTDMNGFHVHRFPVKYSNRMSRWQRLKAFAKFAAVSAGMARSLKGDLVFASSTPLTTAIPGLIAAHFPRRSFVFEVRDMWPDLPIAFGALKSPLTRGAARLLELIAYRQADHIVALSPGMKQRILELAPEGKSVSVVPNAADVELFDVSGSAVRTWREENSWIPLDRPLAVYVGTLGAANKVGFLVDVAVELERIGSDCVVLVVGAGQEKSAILEKATASGCFKHNLFFMERVAKDVVPLIYGASDVVLSCLAPMKELEPSSPNKVFDAFAAGRPVAVNYGGWVAETLQESGAGISTVYDPRLFALELNALVRDECRIAEAGAASRQLGRDSFNRDRLVSRLITEIESLVSSPT